jgi:hypothetical protein
LKFTSSGPLQITDGGIGVFANVSGSKGDYTIHLGSPENFNQQVKFISTDAIGGQVFEVQWTHELEKAITITRTDDTEVNTTDVAVSSTGDAGYDMVPIKALVARFAYKGDDPMNPADVMEDMQMRFLGEPQTDKDSWRNASSYATAKARYTAEGITCHFVLDRHFRWSELEAELAFQCRSYFHYGPDGHEIKFIEDADGLEAVSPAAEFRLPGTPNANATQTPGAPLMERTALSDLVNTVGIYHGRNWLADRVSDVENRFNAFTEQSNAQSVALHGEKRRTEGPYIAGPSSRHPGRHSIVTLLTARPRPATWRNTWRTASRWVTPALYSTRTAPWWAWSAVTRCAWPSPPPRKFTATSCAKWSL